MKLLTQSLKEVSLGEFEIYRYAYEFQNALHDI